MDEEPEPDIRAETRHLKDEDLPYEWRVYLGPDIIARGFAKTETMMNEAVGNAALRAKEYALKWTRFEASRDTLARRWNRERKRGRR